MTVIYDFTAERIDGTTQNFSDYIRSSVVNR